MLTAIVCVLVLVGGEYAWRTMLRPSKPTTETRLYDWQPLPGEPVKDFGLPGDDKKIHRLSDYQGKEFVLAFFCGCGECIDFSRKLARAYRDSNREVPTVGVFVPGWSPKDGMKFWLEQTKARFTYLYTKEQPEIIDLWQGTPCPKAYVVGADQKIKYASPPPVQGHNDAMVADIAKLMGLTFTPSREKPGPPKKAHAGSDHAG